MQTITMLPERYTLVNHMRSYEIRAKLGAMIVEIYALLSRVAIADVSDRSQTVVDRYLSYLHGSCAKGVPHLDRRGKWLLCYATVVRDRLLSEQPALTKSPPPSAEDGCIDQVTKLVMAVTAYRVQCNSTLITDGDHDILCALDDILAMSYLVVPDPADNDYLAMMAEIEQYSTALTYMARYTSLVNDNGKQRVYARLSAIGATMALYTTRCSSVLR